MRVWRRVSHAQGQGGGHAFVINPLLPVKYGADRLQNLVARVENVREKESEQRCDQQADHEGREASSEPFNPRHTL
jgi:hypothetical protein